MQLTCRIILQSRKSAPQATHIHWQCLQDTIYINVWVRRVIGCSCCAAENAIQDSPIKKKKARTLNFFQKLGRETNFFVLGLIKGRVWDFKEQIHQAISRKLPSNRYKQSVHIGKCRNWIDGIGSKKVCLDNQVINLYYFVLFYRIRNTFQCWMILMGGTQAVFFCQECCPTSCSLGAVTVAIKN